MSTPVDSCLKVLAETADDTPALIPSSPIPQQALEDRVYASAPIFNMDNFTAVEVLDFDLMEALSTVQHRFSHAVLLHCDISYEDHEITWTYRAIVHFALGVNTQQQTVIVSCKQPFTPLVDGL